ncbi:(-)-germacrene D synthase [Vitis vinifera]|uniref:(-)-germacrene D synthase n=1 Tax=Vitis vinifera TaxID=29760 RepID=A0A438IDG0_VITVI|nr:(-)-germacrene D synthase [Vitis vinifera]
MGDAVTEETFDWVFSQPKIVRASAIICRLMDDMVSPKFEQTENMLPQLLNVTDPSLWETRGTHLTVTRDTYHQSDHHHPDHHHPDSLRICMMQFSYPDRRKERQMTFQLLLSGPSQGKANDVSASPIQGRANDAGRA